MKPLSIEYFLINHLDLSISKRQEAIKRIENENFTLTQYIKLWKFATPKQITYLLCLLDTISRSKIKYFSSDVSFFVKIGANEIHETNKRSLTNLYIGFLSHNYLTIDQKKNIIDYCFTWLLDDSLIATQCNCLTCLNLLIKDFGWIKEELLSIIDKESSQKPVSYQSRAKKIIKKHRDSSKNKD